MTNGGSQSVTANCPTVTASNHNLSLTTDGGCTITGGPLLQAATNLGSGTSTPVPSGTVVVLSATPASTHAFGGWTGVDPPVSSNPAMITLDADKSVSLSCPAPAITYTLTVTNSDAALGFGHIKENGGTAFQAASQAFTSIPAGSVISLQAIDSVNWGLSTWMVTPPSALTSGSLTDCTITVTMNANVTVNAGFPDGVAAHCP